MQVDCTHASYETLKLHVKLTFSLGHEVIRLTVAHCTLNPIEMAWAQVKGHIKSNAKEFNFTEVEQLARSGFEAVTADRWKKLIKYSTVQKKLSSCTLASLHLRSQVLHTYYV